MDVYRQAADIIKIVRAGNGTAKALCLRKEMQKKRQTYAVVCETLRHYELLEDVLAVSEFFKYYPHANKEFAICMAYDVLLGRGVSTKTDSTARAVQNSASYLREAYWRVHKHHIIPPRTDETFEEAETQDGASPRHSRGGGGGERRKGEGQLAETAAGGGHTAPSPAVPRLPRYARVNTLKIDKDTLVSRLRNAAQYHRDAAAAAAAGAPQAGGEERSGDDVGSRKRSREGNGDHNGAEPEEAGRRRKGHSRPKKGMPDFTEDAIVPSLLVFPHGTDLHAHPAVRSGQLVLQDRASCLPACILLDAVDVARACGDAKAKAKPLEYVIDACAAPGNKTTQLAALGAPHIKLMAIERDERRAELLQRRVQTLGAADYVNVVNMDFFHLSSDDRAATEGILLDPSCSASGVVTRVDVALMHQKHKIRLQEQQSASGSREASHKVGHAVADDEVEEDGNEDGREEDVKGSMNPAEQSAEFAGNEERVEKLAALQRKLLAHALISFDNCRTVVYSTCSVHEAENEDVVRTVLRDARVQERGWKLSNIMPTTWTTRGIVRPEDGEVGPLDFTIRCDPAKDATNGFYVARFDREVAK